MISHPPSAAAAASASVAPRADAESPLLRWLGRAEYEPTWRAMQALTDARSERARDEIWFLEHPPVYTLGMNATREHVLAPGDIPVVQIDRGGQVTYHGPGQLVVYPLLDIRRLGMSVRQLVMALESAVIAMLGSYRLVGNARREAPGVYVDSRKLASIGLRIRRGCSYHGLALNVAMNLEPFRRINPCGYSGLELVDLGGLQVMLSVEEAARLLAPHLLAALGFETRAGWASD